MKFWCARLNFSHLLGVPKGFDVCNIAYKINAMGSQNWLELVGPIKFMDPGYVPESWMMTRAHFRWYPEIVIRLLTKGSLVSASVDSLDMEMLKLYCLKHGVIQSPPKELDDLKNQSVVYVGVDGTLAGLIYVEDQIREDAKLVVESLSKQGVSLYMLSGDKRSTAEYVASMVGIPTEKVICGVKPDEKKKFIRKLQKSQSVVAMVGDGINDAAALASSHVGVAMGGGVGAASEVSSIVLMGNRLSQLLDALELSRLTMKTVKQNLWWAFAYNMVGIPIAAGMLLPVTGTMLTPSIAGGPYGL
ncbi:P-type ATP-ase 1 [Actinidia rufa]|uniref:P-type ATP-ase 1 n=1 Tax=Actinidia rufa TaxID=165716 RepID=A0A7J0ESF0_9ERIC|nr:P-type ATP-ase 1 [Actinidia rufa]